MTNQNFNATNYDYQLTYICELEEEEVVTPVDDKDDEKEDD